MYPLNTTSQELAQGNFAGNIIPHSWFQHILTDGNRPNSIAMMLLAEIVYWYRPFPVKQSNGKAIWYRHYKGDILQKSYEDLENCLGFTKNQLRDAFLCLEKHNLAHRELRTIVVNGLKLSNVLFVRINVKNILKITHSDLKDSITISEISEEGIGNSQTPIEEFPKTNTESTPEITPENVVCSSPPVGGCAQEKIPENIIKKNGLGQEVSITQSDIFRKSLQYPDWKTGDIREAIKILHEYKGIVTDPWGFITGTVTNLHNKTKAEVINKKNGKQWTSKSKIEPIVPSSPKEPVIRKTMGEMHPEFFK